MPFSQDFLGGFGGPSSAYFFQISGEDWEIQWELRISIPALEEGSSLAQRVRVSVRCPKKSAGFSVGC
jgi:hypothetical protein